MAGRLVSYWGNVIGLSHTSVSQTREACLPRTPYAIYPTQKGANRNVITHAQSLSVQSADRPGGNGSSDDTSRCTRAIVLVASSSLMDSVVL